jgi:DNA-binding winged helix-turn-helix (wHTH) protein
VVYRFANFALDESTRQVLADGVEIHVSPKAFDLLVFLLAHQTRAVSKAELQEHLWPTTFVEETNLAGLVAEIRRALHDPAGDPVFIRTVYGFGYRFIGPVTVDHVAPSPTSSRTKLYLVSTHGEMMLMDGANVIGRAADATIQLDSPGVSRYHARVLVAGHDATLQDIESKNGTYLNGQRVSESPRLSDGDEIRLGSVVMTFKIATATSPTATLPAETKNRSA